VFIFPLVFLLALVGCLGNPMARWSDPHLRDAWLLVHIVLVLVGYAALLVTAVTSILYLIRERQLKRKRAGARRPRCRPWGRSIPSCRRTLEIGFLFITLAVVAGSTWASIESGTRWIRDPRIVISLAHLDALSAGRFYARVGRMEGPQSRADGPSRCWACSALTWAAHTALRNLLTDDIPDHGVNHKTAPVEVRERLAFDHTALPPPGRFALLPRRLRGPDPFYLQPRRDRGHGG